MANYSNILGFYVAIGGMDYPRSWSPNKPFGFDVGQNPSGVIPSVYASSFSDMVNVFKTPVTTTKKFTATLNSNNLLSSLTIERPTSDFDMVSVGSDDPNDIWSSVFKLIEYVYYNQDTITFESFQANIIALLGVSPIPYVNNSIEFTKINGSYRIEYFTFTMNFANVVTPAYDATKAYAIGDVVTFDTLKYRAVSVAAIGQSPTTNPNLWTVVSNDNVDFKIYFNPDSLITSESQDRFQVYLYEDVDGNDIISSDEWRSQIVEKTLGIFNTGHYKYYKYLETRYDYIDTLTGNTYTTKHLFIVYTISDNFTHDQVVNAVKNNLLNVARVTGNVYTYNECVFHYPELFLTRSINILPIKNVGVDLTTFISPVTYGLIYKTLVERPGSEVGYEPAADNFKNAEVIYVGNESITQENPIPFPVICVSSITNDDIRPISTVYPDYAPNYKEFTGYTTTNMEELFHRLLFLALNVIIGRMTSSSNLITEVMTKGYGFAISNDVGGVLAEVKFDLQGTTYRVKKMVA